MQPIASQFFDRLDRAHALWRRGGATITVTNTSPVGVTRAKFRLDLDGAGGATLRIDTPAQGKFAETDQGFALRGARIVGVDYDARETIRRPAPDRGSIGLRFAAVLGGLEDAVGFLTADTVRARYLLPLRALAGWQPVSGGLVRRTLQQGKASFTRLAVDPTGRLRTLHIGLPTSQLDWNIEYGPWRPMPVPASLKLVDAFTARPRPSHYANAEAKTAVEGMLRNVGAIQHAIIRLDDNATLWFGGSRIRYEAGGSGFSYDGLTLTVATPGATYTGRSSRRAIIDQVAALLGNVDPIVRTVLVRSPLFLELFPPEAKVRIVASGAIGGEACDILSIEGPHFRSSVFARKSDHLPLSIETSALDGKGREVSTTRRTLAWSSVGTPLPASLFSLRPRPGSPSFPLPPRPRAATGP